VNNSKLLLMGGIILTMIACQLVTPGTKAKVFDHPSFSFTIPAGWQTMEELWQRPQEMGRDYYALGVGEIIMITNARVQADGPYGAYFAVASSPLAGGADLETRFHQTYDPLIPNLRAVSQQKFTASSLTGLEITYQRPWGEPWWQFRDIWVEQNAVIYILSFHALPGDFETHSEEYELILQSFNFK